MLHTSTDKRAKAIVATGAKPALFQDLMVYQDDTEATRAALAYATALAEEADGNVTALMLYMINIYPMGLGEATADVWLAAQRQAEKEADALEKRLRERLAKHAPAAELRRSDVVGGDSPSQFAALARYTDAAILGWSSEGGSEEQRRLFNAALFYSGRPVLVVPEKTPHRGAPARVMIAWSPSQEATRALHDALPLLRHAEAVQIVIVDDSTTWTERHNPGADIAKHLARHDITAEVKHVPQGSHGLTRTLLDEARYFGADMVVLGGYGHSRFFEWMLGGVTREMLASCEVPMLFSR